MKNTDVPSSPQPPLLTDFTTLLESCDLSGYIKKLSRQGLNWLFHFQIPVLAAHVIPLRQFSAAEPPPARIRLLTLAVSPATDSSLPELEQLYQLCIREKDIEAAGACIGIALQAIIDSGRSIDSVLSWMTRAEELVTKDSVSPLVKAFLLLFRVWAEIVGQGDLSLASDFLESMRLFAIEARSPSQLLLYGGLIAHIHFWRADLSALEIILTDMTPLLETPQVSPLAVLQYQAALGLLKTLQGEPQTGKDIYRKLLKNPLLAYVSPGTWLQIQGNYLYTIATLSDQEEAERIGVIMRARSVPEYNHYYHSYLHFNLAIMSLVRNRPHKALLHALENRTYGKLCGSSNVARMSALLIGQALMELDRDEEALDHFKKWLPIWEEDEYFIIAALAFIEVGYLLLRQGKIDQARDALGRAKGLVPKKERIPTLYRPADYVYRLEELLDPKLSAITPRIKTQVSITTLGEFSVTIYGEKTLYDRDWHGSKVKDLLKAVIALGGSRVSTERIAYLLWPDANGDQAMNAFKVTLSRLRKTLAGGNKALRRILVVKQKRISLSSPICSVDALVFADLVTKAGNPVLQPDVMETALDLYGGNFLESSSGYWIINAREELREQFVRATFELCDYYFNEKNIKKTLLLLTRAMQFDPVNELIYTRLLQTHLLLGNRVKAIDLYNRACRILSRELGIEPGAQLRNLYQQLRKN